MKPVVDTFDPETGIARITFNRPEVLNAIDIPTAESFRDAVLRITVQNGVRCIVLAGAGRAFVAGGDVAGFQIEPAKVADTLIEVLHPAVIALRACPAPVVAVVQGAAAGAGLSLALAADYVLAGDKARFVIAYDRIGAPPDCGGTWFLPRRAGRNRAFAMMLLGPTLNAHEAFAAGIVTEVVAQDDLDARADAIARRLASGPTLAYGHFKRLMDDAFAAPLAQHLENERAAFLASTRTADFREGVSAFIEKREPDFKGR